MPPHTTPAAGRAPYAPLLVHPGYHKTGTTWFQRRLFIRQFGYRQIMTHEEVFALLIRPHGLVFDPAPVRRLIESRRSPAGSGLVDVISSEMLSGLPYFGARESEQYAQRLRQVAPEARIVITIREQMRMLAAMYMQYIFRSLTLTPRAFFSNSPTMGYFAFAPEHLEYHRLIKLYRHLFGPDNVHVTNQETLAREPIKLAEDLAAFAGVTANWNPDALVTSPEAPTPHEGVAPILRIINHFRSGPAGLGPLLNFGPVSAFAYRGCVSLGRSEAIRKLLGENRPVTREAVRRYRGFYAESNRELKAMLGDSINLTGYEV